MLTCSSLSATKAPHEILANLGVGRLPPALHGDDETDPLIIRNIDHHHPPESAIGASEIKDIHLEVLDKSSAATVVNSATCCRPPETITPKDMLISSGEDAIQIGSDGVNHENANGGAARVCSLRNIDY